MKVVSIAMKNKIRQYLVVIAIALILLFILFQFVYIAGVFLAAVGSVLLGVVSSIKTVFDSFVSATGFIVFLFMMGIMMVVRNTLIKSIAFNIGFVFLAICALETYFYLRQKNDSFSISLNAVKVNTPTTFWSTNKYLGVIPAPNSTSRMVSTYNDETLFDVNYTIDEHSHRISPPYKGGQEGKSLVFFGCSVTFGYGLEDEDTFPYKVGQKSKNLYKIYNFAFGGYGTHHMLSQIEHGFVKDIVKVNPGYAIYTVIPDHLRRIAGDTKWGASDPHYEIEDQRVVYKGLFSDDKSVISNAIKKVKDSHISHTLFEEALENNRIALFTAMVVDSRDKMKATFPKCKFVVFFSENTQRKLCDKMIESLEKNGVEVHRMSKMIPHFFDKTEKYQIHPPVELHPNAIANEYVANYVINHLIKTSN